MILAVAERDDGTVGLLIGMTREDIDRLFTDGKIIALATSSPANLPEIHIIYAINDAQLQARFAEIAPVVNLDDPSSR